MIKGKLTPLPKGVNIIERPDSTTWEITFPFHVIKSVEELKNVLGDDYDSILHGKTPDHVRVVYKAVDPYTFEPVVGFEVQNKFFTEPYRYIVRFGVIGDAKPWK